MDPDWPGTKIARPFFYRVENKVGSRNAKVAKGAGIRAVAVDSAAWRRQIENVAVQ